MSAPDTPREREPRLRELLRRVEKASGPDRELDWLIAWTFGEEPWAGAPAEQLKFCMRRSKRDRTTVAYTASINAAVSLVERMLPGWAWGTSTEPSVHGRTYHAAVKNTDFALDTPPEIIFGDASYMPTPALALVAALLRALLAQEERT